MDYSKLSREIALDISSKEDLYEEYLAEYVAEKYPQLKIKQKDIKFSLGYILKREAYFILKDENGTD